MFTVLGADDGLLHQKVMCEVSRDGRDNGALRLTCKDGKETVKIYAKHLSLSNYGGLAPMESVWSDAPLQHSTESATLVRVLKQHPSLESLWLCTAQNSLGSHPHTIRISMLSEATPKLVSLILDNTIGSEQLSMYGCYLAALVNLKDFSADNIVIHGDLKLPSELLSLALSHCTHPFLDDPGEQVLDLSPARRLEKVFLKTTEWEPSATAQTILLGL